jgi:hypothetical protein
MSGERELSQDEMSAILALQRLAKKWPRSLTLFSAAGSLVVLPTGLDKGPDGRLSEDDVLARIDGIPNDGGDPW